MPGLPEPAISYAEAFRKLVKNEVEQIPIAKAGNRIVATGIVPYPPGIPLLAPGEQTGKDWRAGPPVPQVPAGLRQPLPRVLP